MKKRTGIVLFLLLALNVCVLSAENLYTIGTKHFDFIYPEVCEETAIILSEKAESLYDKAVSLLQTDIELFLPVYITPYNQQLNAYYTAFPYNRIVYNDTPPHSHDLAVFSETKLSVFYHELVHAVSMNIKNGFWTFLSSVLGDVYSPSYLYSSTLSFIEGATVSFESMDGEGRLNDGDSMAYLVQAKIEDCFPSWKDASGPRDIFPKAQYAYLFGGAFNDYIQKKYGMEKYSELWKQCGNGGGFNPLIEASFKKVYGVSLEEEWNAFVETVPVPALSDADVRAVLDEPSYSSALAYRNGTERGIAFLENGSYIRYVPIDEKTGIPGKTETLLCADSYVSSLTFTDDGRYLLINGIGTNLSNSFSLKIYDMVNEEYVSDEIYPLSSACIVKRQDGYAFLVGVAVRAGRAYLEVRDFAEVLAVGSDASVIYYEKMPVERELYELCAAGEKVWSLEKEHGKWSVVAYEFCVEENRCSLKRQKSYAFPYGIVPSSFTYGGTNGETHTFYFAVTGRGLSAGFEEEPGSLSRLLVMEIPESSPENMASQYDGVSVLTEPLELPVGSGVKHGEHFELYPIVATSILPVVFEPASVSLAKGDVSGGVHNPFYDAATDTLYFIARKAESKDVSYCKGIPGGLSPITNVLAEYPASSMTSGQSSLTANLSQPSSSDEQSPQAVQAEPSAQSELSVERSSYNPLKYIFPGSIIPAGMDLTSENAYLLGASWMLMDPTESLKLLWSGGWDFINAKGGISARAWGGPSFLSYELSFLSEWNNSSFKIFRGKGVLSGAIPLFNRRQEFQYMDTLVYEYEMGVHSFRNRVGVAYATEYKTGIGVFDNLSFKAGATFTTEFGLQNFSPVYCINNIGFFMDAGVGGFLPIAVSASLMPSFQNFLDLSADAVLLSFEIQKGVPLFPLYANRFTITGGYTSNWKTPAMNMAILKFPQLITNLSDMNVKHGVKVGMNFTMSPTMSLTYSFQFKLGADFTWYFGNEQDNKLYDLVLCGVFTF